jgi:hypothetical protein
MADVKAEDLNNLKDATTITQWGGDPMEDEELLDLNFEEVEGIVAEAEQEEEPVEEVVAEDSEEEVEAEDSEEEVEVEDLEEVEAKATPEPESKKHMVPKERLDAVLAKQKALQKQLDDLQAQSTPDVNAPEAYDYDTKEAEYQEFILDGESAKATALRKEIRAAEKAELQYEFDQKMGQTVQQNQQATVLQQAANELENTFPVFNQNSEAFNAEITQEVVDLRDAFITQGYQPVDALAKAANFVVKDYGLVEGDVESPLSAPKTTTPVDEVAKKRANNQKKLQSAQSQPPELSGESSSTHGEKAEDLLSLTEEEFNALPAATLKRMRGDIV